MATPVGEDVNTGIVNLYDDSTTAWEKLWGHHMHHGFYDPGATPSLADNRAALLRMVEEALRFADVSDDPKQRPKRVVDVGCGIGGATIYFAKKCGAQCDGINLSPVQIERARALAVAEGLTDRVTFHIADALEQPFPHGQFDLVWCMEAAEHMPDKRKLLEELVRVAAPGATIVITGMFHRDLAPGEASLKPEELSLLEKLRDAYKHASWFSVAGYVDIAKSLSLQDIKRADWTKNIAPFWPSVMRSVLTWEGFELTVRSGSTTVNMVLMAPKLIEGFETNVINYSIITCRKPQ